MLDRTVQRGWRPDLKELLAIFVGGFAGAIARAALGDALTHDPAAWPWATFLVNVGGALLLGYATTRLQERLPLSAYRRPLIGTGFCGALTTFSALQIEFIDMLDAGRYALAASYATASVAGGFAAVHLGTGLARRARLLARA
jgi:CrcB protein